MFASMCALNGCMVDFAVNILERMLY